MLPPEPRIYPTLQTIKYMISTNKSQADCNYRLAFVLFYPSSRYSQSALLAAHNLTGLQSFHLHPRDHASLLRLPREIPAL